MFPTQLEQLDEFPVLSTMSSFTGWFTCLCYGKYEKKNIICSSTSKNLHKCTVNGKQFLLPSVNVVVE